MKFKSCLPNPSKVSINAVTQPLHRAQSTYSDATITIPSLELLHISFFTNPRHVALLARFIIASNLHILQLKDLHSADFSQILPMFGSVATGFRSITELTLAGIKLPELLAGQRTMAGLFSGLPLLTRLNVACGEMDIENYECLLVPSPSVTLPNLHTVRATDHDLILFVERRRDIGKPLSTLILPNDDDTMDEESLSVLTKMLAVQFFTPSDDEDSGDEDSHSSHSSYIDSDEGWEVRW